MRLNANARKPDLIFFMNVSNEVVQQRMDIRNKPKELFEENLSQTREKFLSAIEFLKLRRGENIEIIDANGTITSVLQQMAKVIYDKFPDFQQEQLLSIREQPQGSTFKLDRTITLEEISKEFNQFFSDSNNTVTKKKIIENVFDSYSFSKKGNLFLNHLEKLNYTIGEQITGSTSIAYRLSYLLPGGLSQRGAALLITEEQRYDSILTIVNELKELIDFLFVFVPGPANAITQHFERATIVRNNNQTGLFPNVKIISVLDLQNALLDHLSR